MASDSMTIIKRTDTTFPITFTDSSGDPINITGYTIFFTVKANDADADADAIISKTISSHSDPTNGVTSLTITYANSNVAPGLYVYDLSLKNGAGLIQKSTRGTFEVVQDVTQRTS